LAAFPALVKARNVYKTLLTTDIHSPSYLRNNHLTSYQGGLTDAISTDSLTNPSTSYQSGHTTKSTGKNTTEKKGLCLPTLVGPFMRRNKKKKRIDAIQ
jgi:hypothetical protein